MNAQELFNFRVKNIVDATSFKEPEKVPVGMDYLNWPYGYAGVTLEEVKDDPVKNAECYCKFMADIPFDCTMNPGFYDPYDAFTALGSKGYFLSRDNCTVQHNQAEGNFMTEDEYDLLIENPGYFMNEYFPKRNVPAFKLPKEEAYEKLKEAAKATLRCCLTTGMIAQISKERFGIVPMTSMGNPGGNNNRGTDVDANEAVLFGGRPPFNMATIDTLFDTYRGMMGIFEDLMDNTEKLDQAIEAIRAFQMKIMPPPGEPDGIPLPMGFAIYHSASYLSPEQYDKYWFQQFKQTMLPHALAGRKIYLKGEGSFLHTIERFKEMPKGSVAIQLDNDDPFEAKKLVGDHVTLVTGIRTAMFTTCTEQQIKDHVKRSFDELAPGGGFIFYQDKPFLSPWDADPELVKNIWAFANEYSYGKS